MLPKLEPAPRRCLHTRLRRGAVLGLLCAAASLCVGTGAQAQPPEQLQQARALFREGSKLAQQERWSEACERFERALRIKHSPLTIYSLAVAQKNDRQLVAALEGFRAFLREPEERSSQRFRGPAEAAVTELEAQVASVVIVVEPKAVEGLKVSLDGKELPRSSLGERRLVDPGAHRVRAKAPGWSASRVDLRLVEGGSADVRLRLTPALSTGSGGGSEGEVETAAAGSEQTDTAGRSPSLALPVSLLVAGGVTAVTGVVLGVVGLDMAQDAPTSDGPEADTARTVTLAGDITAVTGMAIVGAGLIVLFTQGPDAPNDEPVAALAPWWAGNLMGVQGQF